MHLSCDIVMKHLLCILLTALFSLGQLTAQTNETTPEQHSGNPDSLLRRMESGEVYVRDANPYLKLVHSYPISRVEFTAGEFQLHTAREDALRNPIMTKFFDESWQPEHKPVTSNLDSLAKESRTEYFSVCAGDSLSFMFGSNLQLLSDTARYWWNISDTLKVYFDIIDSASGKTVQILDSIVVYPFDRSGTMDVRSMRHNIDLAYEYPGAYPLTGTYALNVPGACANVCLQMRPYFGATTPGQTAAFEQYMFDDGSILSEEPFRFKRDSESYKEQLTARSFAMLQKYASVFDPALYKIITIQTERHTVDSLFIVMFTSKAAKQWNITVEDESGAVVHTFSPVYTFPNVEQSLEYVAYNLPKGLYLMLFRTDDKLANAAMFIKQRFGESLFDSATPTKEPMKCH